MPGSLRPSSSVWSGQSNEPVSNLFSILDKVGTSERSFNESLQLYKSGSYINQAQYCDYFIFSPFPFCQQNTLD